MRGWTTAAFGALVGGALACGGFGVAPTVHSLDVQVDDCGRWTALIEAQGRADTLTLTEDGQPVGAWTVRGGQGYTAKGQAPPGRHVVFEARIGDSTQTEEVDVPAPNAFLVIAPQDATFPAGTDPTFDVYLASQCDLAGATYTARSGTWSSVDRPISPQGTAHLVLPPAAPGPQQLRVEVTWRSTPIASASAPFDVGDDEASAAGPDLDHDGYPGGPGGTDCDDHDPNVNPGRPESPIPNGKDDNCDGRIDEGTIAYDDDGDGYTEEQGDCDDADPNVHPGAKELPDCRDDNCNGQVDEGVTLVAHDDSYEPDDQRAHAFDLATSRMHAFDKDLVAVTRDASDDEWFEFFSQDGDFDEWGIDVEVRGLPVGSVYDIEIDDPDGSVRARKRVNAEHQVISLHGSPFHDDSGNYLLHIHPVQVPRAWCPLTVHLESR